jgi:hypothetical protein
MIRTLVLILALFPVTAWSADYAVDLFWGPINANHTTGTLLLAGQVSWLDDSALAPVAALRLWRRTEEINIHSVSADEYRLVFMALDLGIGGRAWSTEVSRFGFMGVVTPSLVVARLSDYRPLPAPPSPVVSGDSVSWSATGGVRFGGTLLLRTGATNAIRFGFEYLAAFDTISDREAMLSGGSMQLGFSWNLPE